MTFQDPGSLGAVIADPRMADENDMSQRIERSINGLKALGADEHLAPGSLCSRMRHFHVPGVSVSVVDEGALAWSRGFGLLDAHDV